MSGTPPADEGFRFVVPDSLRPDFDLLPDRVKERLRARARLLLDDPRLRKLSRYPHYQGPAVPVDSLKVRCGKDAWLVSIAYTIDEASRTFTLADLATDPPLRPGPPPPKM